MVMRRALLLLPAAGLLGACNAQFTPETLVDSLRILSLVAEPPEVAPGETTSLRLLQTDPTRPAKSTSIIWVGCEPDPQDLGRSACNNASVLLKPSLITDYPPGLKLLGFGSAMATYSSTPGVFSVLEPGDPIRQNGTVGQVLAIVVGEEVPLDAVGEELAAIFKRVEDKVTPAVIGVTRIIVSERPVKNRNPIIAGLTFDGAPLPKGATVQVLPGQELTLGVEVPDSAREVYDELLPAGPVSKTEVVVGAWYSSAGRFSRERFDVASTESTVFTAPGSDLFPSDPVPERRRGDLWLVVRDNRGGQAFEAFQFYVCDAAQPTPKITSIEPPTEIGGYLVLRGENLEQVLDVVIGDAALDNGGFRAGAPPAFVGLLPPLASGSYPVSVRAKNCTGSSTGLTYTVP
jgi:hypothetical protein